MAKIKQSFLLLILLMFAVGAFAQGKRITVDFKNTEAVAALRQIEKQSGLKMQYSIKNMNFRVTYSARNAEPVKVVKDIVGSHGFSVGSEGKYLTIYRASADPSQLSGRKRKVSGYVRDESGDELVGVPVCIGEGRVCTVTDDKGFYTFEIPVESVTLKYSYVGLGTEYVQIAQGNADVKRDVVMRSNNELEEVVVINNGLFTRKAESFTGAVTIFDKEELRKVGNTNVLQSLKNLDPSFHFAENLTVGSNPNAMPEITLRGNSGFPDLYGEYSTNPNQPLFVVDGFETSMAKVIDMDMNRIESVTILKDAAAKAIYGSKAANGVVIIETVKPESGKLRVSYTGSLSLSFPDLSSYDLCNSAEKIEVERLAGLYDYDGYNGVIHWINANGQYAYNLQYNNLLGRVVQGIDTDWKAQPVRNAVGHKHTVYVEGGNKEFQYGIDLGYNDVAGVMKGSDRQTYSGGLTFRYHYKKLLLSDQMSVIYNRANNSPWGSFSTYTSMNPYFEPYDADGNLIKSYTLYEGTQYESQLANPMWNAFIKTKDTSSYMSVTNNMYAEFRLFEGFRLTTRFTIARQENRSDVYLPPSHTNFISYTSEELLKRRGTYTYGDGSSTSYSLDVTANYSKTFAEKHLIFLNLGWSQNESSSNSMTMRAEGFPNDNFSNIGYASAYYKDSSPTSSESTIRDAGAIGAFNYSFDNRYLFDASFRLNGSSQFGSENRWGKFWALGIGWNINNEEFLKETGIFDLLKLRASVGFTGSQNFNSYQSLATYTYFTDRYYNSAAGTYLMGMANNNLKWQRKMDRNIGLDASVFKRRLSLRFDYYNAITDDLLTNVTIPSSTGFTTYKENLGKVENKGWEAYANVRLFEQNSTRSYFNIYASLSHNSNKIKEISNALESYNNNLLRGSSTSPVLVYQEGQSMTAIRAVRSMGIDPVTGKEVYIKRDGTTTFTWSSDDQVIVGDSEADIYGNCGFNASYRGFQLNVGMTYQFGGMIYNSTLVSKVENANLSNNVDRRVFTDRWTKPGDVARFKAMSDESTTYTTERFVEKNDVWNFSSINLSYDFDRIKAVRKAGFSRLRLSFDMADIARIASMKTERGISYPYAKSCSFSLQAIF